MSVLLSGKLGAVHAATTQIDPGKIVIDGGTSLADWRGTDKTTINGGKVETGSLDAEKATFGKGGNFLENARWQMGLTGIAQWGPGTAAAETTASIRDAGQNWAGATYPTLQIFQNGTGTDTVTTFLRRPEAANNTDGWPVTPGAWYEVSAQAATYRCSGGLRMVFRDASGAWIGAKYDALPDDTRATEDPANPDSWTRYWAMGQAPANAVAAQLLVEKAPTDAGFTASYIFVHKPYLGETHQYATGPTPWSPGSQTSIDGNQITTGAVKSTNYVPGSSGWNIDTAGNAEFNNLVARGWIQDGAVSKGGDYYSATEAQYESGDLVAEFSTGDDHLATDFWYIGGIAEIRGNSTQDGTEARLIFQFTCDEWINWHNVEVTDSIMSGYGWRYRSFGITSPFIRNNLVQPYTNLKIGVSFVLVDSINNSVPAEHTNARNVGLYMYCVVK